MKRFIVIFITFLFFTASFFSCATLKGNSNIKKTSVTRNNPKYGYEQKAPNPPINEYLEKRVWILAGCKFNDDFKTFSANLTSSRIRFIDGGKFEATSGINNYYGEWKLKKTLNDFEHRVVFKISNVKNIDASNTIGIPFDKAFRENLESCSVIEIDQYSIRYYSKDGELLLHFIRS